MIPTDFKLSVIMPVYNEKNTVLRVLDHVLQVPVRKEIVIVDNCSIDGTRDMLKSVRGKDIRVVFHPQNLGRGTSVRTGLSYCTGDYTLTQGADLEYNPQEWPSLIEQALARNLDAVFGSRTLGGKAVYVYYQNYVGVLFLNVVINLLYGSRYTDSATECKMIRTSVYQALDLQCSGFDLDFEVCARLALGRYSYGEVPISYHPRSIAEGKKLRAVQDGVAAMRTILRSRFAPRSRGR